MNPHALARPLELAWAPVIDRVLAEVARPAVRLADVDRLGRRIAELSAAYNEGRAEGARTKLPLDARIAFSFPRDVAKGAGAVRELVASGALRLPRDRPLRVLDLGAGLGAMTWGLARALAAAAESGAEGVTGRVEACLVDEDEAVLHAAEALGRAIGSAKLLGGIEVAIRAERGDVSRAGEAGRAWCAGGADLVFLGQVLSEIAPAADPDARLAAQSTLLRELLTRAVAPGGALVIVEPALRDRTRHLHRLRDRLLELEPGTRIVAPCLHAERCPALATETEWCHEDLPVDLPEWVVPLARAAGLRWQGLTFSYLVVARPDSRPDSSKTEAPGPRLTQLRFRAVSELLRSKGKAELWICTDAGARTRIRRLDRHAGSGRGDENGVPFDRLRRGDVVTIAPPPDEKGTLLPEVAIDVGAFAN
jgi:ribosomal protein RSM22 (predicted rRNA methylase)